MLNFEIGKYFEKSLLAFSPKIELNISIDSFTLKRDLISKTYKTYLYISKDEKKPRIISVGETPLQAFEAKRIDFFELEDKIDSNTNKYDCLEAFLKYCIRDITPKFSLIRPTIMVKGINELQPILNGFQNKILQNILTDAGAARVVFEDGISQSSNL